MTARALVTGGAGFVGQWLARAMLERGWSVVSASVSTAAMPPILTPAERKAVRWLPVDVQREEDVERAVDESAPDVVVHLAGVSFVPQATGAPAQAYEVNVLGAVRLLNAIARRRRAGTLDPRVLVVGSATQYGRHDPADLPLDERAEQRPLSVYAATKAAQEIAALQAHRAEGLHVICTRSFNHSGPGHGARFLLPALVNRALALRASGSRELPLGDADAVRDYLHVGDVVRAYLLLLERGTAGEVYNVCSGTGVSARELASEVLLQVGATADITTDPALLRARDVPVLVGTPCKLEQATGWRPEKTRADIIDDLIHAATH